MTQLTGHSKGSRHSLADWLTLHELDVTTCLHILDAIHGDAADNTATYDRANFNYPSLDVETAWDTIADSMRDFLPQKHMIIDDTFENTTKVAVRQGSKSRKALTLDNGESTYPTIIYNFHGDLSDALIIAHELGHALQIRASEGKFVPPIMREVCAFLGEHALLSLAERRDPKQFTYLIHSWRQDNLRYLGVHRDRLISALSRPSSSYEYFWNYPIARLLAIQILERFSQEKIWMLFEGRASVLGVLQDISLPSS